MQINLNNEHYYLEQFHCYETYGGKLLGKITEEYNRELINRPPDEKLRDMSVHTIFPDESLIKTELPIHECYAIISSAKIVANQDADGSHIAVRWYSDLENDLKTEVKKSIIR